MKPVLAVLTIFLSIHAFAQSEEDAVKNAVNKLFDGMRKSDAQMILSSFAEGGMLQTIAHSKDGKTVVRTDTLTAFASAISQPHKDVYDERIKFETIRIDGELAIVWAPYEFYVGDKFSHCGVDSFQLVKINGEWKIQYIIDTRKREGCSK